MAKRDMVLSLSEMVKHLLQTRGVPFEVWDRSDYLTILHAVVASGFGGGGQLARAVFLRDDQGLVLALLSDPEDTALPGRRLQRPLTPTLPFDVLESERPEAELWIAPEFRNADNLILDVGSGQEVIQVAREQLEEGFRTEDDEEVTELQVYELLARIALDSPNPEPLWDLATRLQAVDELPTPTPFLEGVLGLALAAEPDPEALLSMVAGEVLARPGYPQPEPALARITQLLEHETAAPEPWWEAMHLALGYALVRQFPVSRSGLLGAPWCWRHLMLTARLAILLGERMSPAIPPHHAFLAGWLHDVGHLYLAQVFPREFSIFNHLLERHPHRAVEDMERRLLGLTHTHLGAALLHHWGLPEAIVEAVRSHHEPDPDGPGQAMADMLLLADRLAHRHDGGDAESAMVPPWLLHRHALSHELLSELLQRARRDLAEGVTLLEGQD